MEAVHVLAKKARDFRSQAHKILGVHEASKSRVFLLEESYKSLGTLSLKQDDLFRQSLRCIENELFRAAHVLGWAAFIDFVHEKLASDGFVKINIARPSWTITSVEDFRENITDHALLEAAEKAGLYRKSERKALQGLLAKRNEAAHPSNYFPGLNESLGYLSELLQRIESIKKTSF